MGTHNVFVTLGASNHTDKEREELDFYATDPKAMELLLEKETFSKTIWEPACGQGHLSKVLIEKGYNVIESDIVDRGRGNHLIDFLNIHKCPNNLIVSDSLKFDIITNPPYSKALEFVEKSLELVENGSKVAMFLRLSFLEGKKRGEFFKKFPPKYVYVASGRIQCAKNGDFNLLKSGTAVAHAWFIWEKGFKGEPIIRWFN